MKDWLWNTKKVRVPEMVSDRDILKFIQANFFVIDKVGEKLANHFIWLATL